MSSERVAPVNPRNWSLHHGMIRVRDPATAVAFYKRHFSMTLVEIKRFAEAKFDVYFLATLPPGTSGPTPETPEAHAWLWTYSGSVLELTHNYGTETDAEFKYANGNTEPYRGFGHIGFIVDDVHAFCGGLEAAGVRFQKRLTDGKMKDIAFVLDEDGYWIEILPRTPGAPGGYPSLQQIMLRVRDPAATLAFYEKQCNASLVCRRDFPDMKFSLYFMGTFPPGTALPADPSSDEAWRFACGLKGTLLEFTHNHGTESDPDFKGYHNGNSDPGRGFGHVAFLVDELDSACVAMEADGVAFTKRPHEGRMRQIAFAKDPDGYLVELIQRLKAE